MRVRYFLNVRTYDMRILYNVRIQLCMVRTASVVQSVCRGRHDVDDSQLRGTHTKVLAVASSSMN